MRRLFEVSSATWPIEDVLVEQVSLPHVDERLVDSQLYEPIPFRTAVEDGCTHVLVLRSRPDGGGDAPSPCRIVL